MEIAGGRETESAGELCSEVADDVAEKIAGDDHVKLARIANDLHGQGVDVKVAGVDLRIFLADLLEDALPEVVGEGHGVGFVAHANAPEFVLASVVEGMPDDSLDALAGVDVFLNGNFVGSVFLEEAAHADVKSFGIFAEDDKADVVCRAIAEGREAIMKKFNGAGVDKKVKLEAQTKQDVCRVLVRWNARVAEGAEEDRIEFGGKHFYGARRKRDAFAKKFNGAPGEFDKLDLSACRPYHSADGLDGFGRNFLADAVAWNYGDASRWTAFT